MTLFALQPMVPIAVEEPTVRMTFGVNKSPLAGREGKFLTTRMIRDRLMKELDRNVALRVDETDSSDVYEVRSILKPVQYVRILVSHILYRGYRMKSTFFIRRDPELTRVILYNKLFLICRDPERRSRFECHVLCCFCRDLLAVQSAVQSVASSAF